MRVPRRRLFVGAVVAALVATACTGEERVDPTLSAQPQRGGTLRIGATWLRLDPHTSYTGFAHMYLPGWEVSRCCLLRTLYSYPGLPAAEGGGEVEPDLALDLPEVSSDGMIWTIRIKDGIRYAPPLDDVEITTPDVVRAIERAASTSPFRGSYSSFFLDVEGFDAFRLGHASSISGVETPDQHTLVVRLTAPSGDLASRLALPATAPIPPNPFDPTARLGVAEGHDVDYGRILVSSGPYMVEGSEAVDFALPPWERVPASGYEAGASLALVRNPSWDPSTDPIRLALADRIEIVMGFGAFGGPSRTDAEIAALVRSGALDVALTPLPTPLAQRYRVDQDPAVGVVFQPVGLERFIAINVAQPPFDDVHVRKALNLVLDKDALRRLAEELYGTTADVARHVGLDRDEDDLLAAYDPYRTAGDRGDPSSAMDEMRLSAYDADGDGRCDGPDCRDAMLVFRLDQDNSALATRVAQDAGRVGIHLDLRSEDQVDCFDPRTRAALCIGWGWAGDYPDAANWFPGLFEGIRIECPEPYSSAGLCLNASLVGATAEQLDAWGYEATEVPSVDERIGRCLQVQGQARYGCWAELDRFLMEAVVPWVPFYLETAAHAYSSRIRTLPVSELTRRPALDRIAVAGSPPGSLPRLTTFSDPVRTGESGIPDGTYVTEITLDDALGAGMPARPGRCMASYAEAACPVGSYTLTVRDGRFRLQSDAPDISCVADSFRGFASGRITVEGSRATFVQTAAPCEGNAWVLWGSSDGDLLTLEVSSEAALVTDQYARVIFETNPWERVGP
jgi:peptide/nickel transport system substrate-binding protein